MSGSGAAERTAESEEFTSQRWRAPFGHTNQLPIFIDPDLLRTVVSAGWMGACVAIRTKPSN